MVKTFPAERGIEANVLAVQVHGGYGYTSEYLPELWLRDQIPEVESDMIASWLMNAGQRSPQALRSLRKVLSKLYPQLSFIRLLASDAGIDLTAVALDSGVEPAVGGVLEAAERLGRFEALITIVEADNPDNEELTKVLLAFRNAMDGQAPAAPRDSHPALLEKGDAATPPMLLTAGGDAAPAPPTSLGASVTVNAVDLELGYRREENKLLSRIINELLPQPHPELLSFKSLDIRDAFRVSATIDDIVQKCASVLPEMRVYLAAPIPNDGTTARFQLLISHSAREGEWLVGHKLTGDSNVARVYLRGGTYGHEDTLLAPRGTNDPVDNERCIMGFPVNLTWKKCVAVLGISSPLPNAIRKYDPVYQFGQRTAIHLAVLVERHLREQGEGKERVKAFQGELLGYYNVIKGRPA